MQGAVFIVFEGVDGAGKSTQVRLLKGFFLRNGYPCITTREPGGTPLAEKLRAAILHNSNLDPMTRLLLIIAARVDHCNKVILPALRSGKIIICDRFIYSTLAYQGYGDKMDPQLILDLHKASGCFISPDLTLLLLSESACKMKGKDNFERMSESYFSDVIRGYEKIALKYEDVHIVKRMGIRQTHDKITKIVESKIREKQTSKPG